MLTNRIEDVIFYNLFFNENYTKRVIAFLQPEMFFDPTDRNIFECIYNHINQYKNSPTPEAVLIACDKNSKITEPQYKNIVDLISRINQDKNIDHQMDWLISETEKFCQEKSIIKAILEANDIINKESKKQLGEIPEIIKNALSISFDPNIGHSYFEDIDDAYENYHKKENHIPCDLEMLNKITKGGVIPKTLNILMAGTNVGKSFALCHLAASYLSLGYNVLYISLEMDKYGIRERIDANLMNVQIDDVLRMSKGMFVERINKLRQKHSGNLIIKEYPTTGANVNHFRSLLQEMHLKRNFVPDIILIDYLNLTSSSRFKPSTRSDMYTYIKSVAEELRSLGQEFNLPIWTATQLNREGFKTDEPGLENSSESFGTAMTADLVLSLSRTEELDTMGKLKVKVLKNRYNNTSICRRFILGFDLSRMKLFDEKEDAQVMSTNNTISAIKNNPQTSIESLSDEIEKPDLKSKFRNAFVYDDMLNK
jgi:replicative DNA helicase